MTEHRMRARLAQILAVLAVMALGWSVVIWLGGGSAVTIAGLRLSATTPLRPFVAGIVAACAAWWLAGRALTRDQLVRPPQIGSARAAIVLAVLTSVVGLAGNSWTASGPDPFAYVSQAALWRAGQATLPVPLAAEAPWPNAVTTFSPFGYRAAPGGAAAIVPITAPGVPLVMAALQSIAGHGAAFVVTPIAGGALVWLTFAIGRRLTSAKAGAIAAWLVATSPALLYSLMWPMADVPASACAALMVWLLLGTGTRAAVGAGLAAAAGTLSRPNFVVIAAAGGVWLILDALAARQSNGVRRVIAFAVAVLPALVFMAWLNARWFGSPWASGYGTAGQLFSVGLVGLNLARYTRALAETSPLAFLGLAALPVLVRDVRTRRGAWLLSIVAVAAIGVFLLYESFPEWWYLRFLLPAWPGLFVPAGVALAVMTNRGRWPAALAWTIVVVGGVAGVVIAGQRSTFGLGDGERRYVTIARLVETHTEPNAVIITCQHSGTVWYYTGRQTVRFDLLDPDWFDRAVDWLAARGRHPYVLIEDWEQPAFEARFAAHSRFSTRSTSPMLVWQSRRKDGYVWLFDPMRAGGGTLQPGPEIDQDQPLVAAPSPRFLHGS
jgi:hypothetical protein